MTCSHFCVVTTCYTSSFVITPDRHPSDSTDLAAFVLNLVKAGILSAGSPTSISSSIHLTLGILLRFERNSVNSDNKSFTMRSSASFKQGQTSPEPMELKIRDWNAVVSDATKNMRLSHAEEMEFLSSKNDNCM